MAAPGRAPRAGPHRRGNGFVQLGWAVDLTRYDEALVSARRDDPLPVTTVRIKLDRP